MAADVNNTAQLGRLIYTDYILLFQVSGLVLLVAMIGAIVLTLRDKKTSRRQVIAAQIARTAADTLEMMDVRTGAGVKELGILRPKQIVPADDPHDDGDHHAPADHGAVDHAHGGHH